MSKTCNLCGKENAAFKCSTCKQVWYCSSAHQQSDWPKHKKENCNVEQIESTYEAREREKIVAHLKSLADRYTAGENMLPSILEYTLKTMSAADSKAALMRYGFAPAKGLANIEKLDDEQQDKLNAVSSELTSFVNLQIQVQQAAKT